jgi:hypothetical protein
MRRGVTAQLRAWSRRLGISADALKAVVDKTPLLRIGYGGADAEEQTGAVPEPFVAADC